MAGSLFEHQVVAAAPTATAVELLEALPLAVNARWQTTKGTRLLTCQPELAEFELDGEHLVPQKSRALWQMWGLSPAQVGQLLKKRFLSPSELDPERRKALKTLALYAFATRGWAVAPESLDLDGCYLQLDVGGGPATGNVGIGPVGRPAPLPPPNPVPRPYKAVLVVAMRGVDGSLEPSYEVYPSNISGEAAKQAQAISFQVPYFPPQRLPLENPATPEPVDLKQDPTLAERVNVAGTSTVMSALVAIARTGKVNFLASTRFHYFPLKVQPGPPTVRGVMEAVATVSGGTWCRKGSIYVLHTDPVRERVVALKPEFRREWMTLGFDQAARAITKEQRSILTEKRKLVAGDLNEEQTVALRWVLACAAIQGRVPTGSTSSVRSVELVPGEGRQLRLLVRPTGDPPIEVLARDAF